MKPARSALVMRHCVPGGATPLPAVTAHELLTQLDDWEIRGSQLVKTFTFKHYYETIAFVNALALISHREDHHPELVVSYNRCEVRYDTHSAGGLTENDFICAAKADAMLTL